MHAWRIVDLRAYLAKKNHGYSIPAKSYDFCPHLTQLDILDFTLSHRRFRIGLPKIHRRFRIGPPHVFLNLLPQEFHRWGILLTIAIMKEKQQNNLFEIDRLIPNS